MAAPMTYDFILRDKDDPGHRMEWPLGGAESVCWYRLGQRMDDLDGEEWDDHGIKTPVLDTLIYDFDTDFLGIDEVRQVMGVLFDTCQYGVEYVITKNTAGHPYRMTLTKLDDIPRGLFMHKMFVIRNLIRDSQSTQAFRCLLAGGVPFNIAAYFGAGLEMSPRFGGKVVCMIKDYAGFLHYKNSHFAHAVRSMANNIYCEQKSLPWKEGWGYNHLLGDGKDENGRYLPLPQEIEGAAKSYTEGDHLPESWDINNNFYDMDSELLTKLMRLICQDDNINIEIKMED